MLLERDDARPHGVPGVADEDEPILRIAVEGGETRLWGPASLRLGTVEGSAEGPFARWRWDGRELEIATDRYGFFPLYYSETGSTFAVSPSIPALLRAGASGEPDEPALSVLLRLGFFVGEDTPFLSIRALPPGARLRWRPGKVQVSSDLPSPRPLRIGRDAAIDAYVDLFRAAIRRRAPRTPFAVPLSGGQDSRHILLELREQGHHPALCVTARYDPPRATPDAEIAAQLAGALGIRHEIVAPPPSQLKTLLRHYRVTNLCTLTPSGFLHAVADLIRSRQVPTVYDGIGGDVLSGGLFLSPERIRLFAEGRFDRLADDLLGRFDGGSGFDEPTLRRAFASPIVRDRAVAVARLSRELARHAHAANPMTSFCFFNRTRRDIALMPFRILAGIPWVHCPFLDRDLFDLLAALPAELLLDRSLHAGAIGRAYPRWAGIPYASWKIASGPSARDRHRSLGRELILYSAFGLRPGLLRASYVAPRAIRALLDPAQAQTFAWLAPLVVYSRLLKAARRAHG